MVERAVDGDEKPFTEDYGKLRRERLAKEG